MKTTNLFFALAILTILGIMTAVLIMVLVKKKSVEEAVRICKSFICKLFSALFSSEQVVNTIYPTIVGYDGYRVVPEFVDSEFQTVRNNFAVCYCSNFCLNPDYIQYRFNIQRKLNSPADEELEPLIQKQAEEVVVKTMRLYDFYLPAEPLTVIELRHEVLLVAFARNEEGVRQLDRVKHSIRRRKYSAVQSDNSSMTEDWKNGDNQ